MVGSCLDGARRGEGPRGAPGIHIIRRRGRNDCLWATSACLGASAEERGLLTPAMGDLVATTLLAFATFGYTTGVLSGAAPMMGSTFGLNEVAAAMGVPSGVGAAAVGAAVGGYAGDVFGRLSAVKAAAVVATVATVWSAVAPSYRHVLLARGAASLGVGIISTVVPLYIAEAAPPDFRGRCVDLSVLGVVLGQLLSGIVNGLCSLALLDGGGGGNDDDEPRRQGMAPWRASLCLGAPLPFLLVFSVVRNYESPRWLAKVGRRAEALHAVAALHGGAADEHDEIVDALTHHDEDVATEARATWCSKRVLRALALGVGLQAFNQLSGVNTAMFYGANVLITAGFDEEKAIWLASMLAVAQLVGVLISVLIIDSRGRRFTALWSVALTIPFLAALTLAFVFDCRILAVVFLLGYLVAFGAGLSGVTYVMNSEIYPLAIRGRCSAIGALVYWLTSFAVALCFPFVGDTLGPEYAFGFFCVVSCGGFAALWRYLPETAHRSLDEISTFFDAEPYPMRAWARTTRAEICHALHCRPVRRGERTELSYRAIVPAAPLPSSSSGPKVAGNMNNTPSSPGVIEEDLKQAPEDDAT